MSLPCAIKLNAPWLTIDFPEPLQVLSWAIDRPGFVEAERLVWREVKNKDLPIDLDVRKWLLQQLDEKHITKAVTLLTSRTIEKYVVKHATIEGVTALSVVTAGLSNAERVGKRVDRSGKDWGTINVAVVLDAGLTQAAMLEAMSIATEARTAAMCDARYKIATGYATGTGTDCIAIAAPEGDTCFAGLHTAIGEAIGKTVYDAISHAVSDWMIEDKRHDYVSQSYAE